MCQVRHDCQSAELAHFRVKRTTVGLSDISEKVDLRETSEDLTDSNRFSSHHDREDKMISRIFFRIKFLSNLGSCLH